MALGRPRSTESAANAMIWQAESLGLSPHAWPRPDGSPVDDDVWASPARALASLELHWGLSGGWWPSQDVTYRKPESWVPRKGLRFADLVDSVSRELLHRPASKHLLEPASHATGCRAKEKITRDHELVEWGFPRLLAAVLDSPDHLAC